MQGPLHDVKSLPQSRVVQARVLDIFRCAVGTQAERQNAPAALQPVQQMSLLLFRQQSRIAPPLSLVSDGCFVTGDALVA